MIGIIQIVIAWTCVAVFIFTSIATCLALVGIIHFPFPNQQKKLFHVLIIEIVIICTGFFSDLLPLKDTTPPAPTVIPPNMQLKSRDLKTEAFASGSSTRNFKLAQNRKLGISTTMNPLTFDEITIGDYIALKPKDRNQQLQFKVYDNRPTGIFGTFGKQTDVIDDSQKLKVLGKYVTPARHYKWLQVEYIKDSKVRTGWFSWGNQKTDTFKLDT